MRIYRLKSRRSAYCGQIERRYRRVKRFGVIILGKHRGIFGVSHHVFKAQRKLTRDLYRAHESVVDEQISVAVDHRGFDFVSSGERNLIFFVARPAAVVSPGYFEFILRVAGAPDQETDVVVRKFDAEMRIVAAFCNHQRSFVNVVVKRAVYQRIDVLITVSLFFPAGLTV